MGSTAPPEYAAWKRAPAHRRCVCEGVYCLQLLSCNSVVGGRSQRQLCWGWLGSSFFQHNPLALSLFITGIRIVPNGHSRQWKPNKRKDLIQFPIKFRRKTNNFSDNRSWTGTYMNGIPRIILFLPKIVQTAAISSGSWNLRPPNSSTPANTTCINSSIIWFSPN